MSRVTINADNRGVAVEITVETAGTNEDYNLVLDRALRAVAAALALPTDAADLFDQDSTQPSDPDADLESTPTEQAAARARRATY